MNGKFTKKSSCINVLLKLRLCKTWQTQLYSSTSYTGGCLKKMYTKLIKHNLKLTIAAKCSIILVERHEVGKLVLRIDYHVPVKTSGG